MIRITLLVALILLIVTPAFSQFTQNPIVVDGAIDNGIAYKTEGNWAVCWDHDFLYVFKSDNSSAEASILYFDIDPLSPGDTGTNVNGNFQGDNSWDVIPELPFRADLMLYWERDNVWIRVKNNTGGWNAPVMIANTPGTTTSPFLSVRNHSNNNKEIALDWRIFPGSGTRPSSFLWTGYNQIMVSNTSIFDPVPSLNATTNDPLLKYYYNVSSTDNNVNIVSPFQRTSYETKWDDTALMASDSLYDLVIWDTARVVLHDSVLVQRMLKVNGVLETDSFTLSLGAEASADFGIHALLEINKSAAVVDFNNRPVTLRSGQEGSAAIGHIKGILLGATNVTVERFIGTTIPKRAWRMITSSVTGTTINAAWQEGVTSGNPNPGYGTHITGGSVSDGFDQGTSANPSIKKLVPDAGVGYWEGLANTNADISDEQGYMLFVRGDRSVNLLQGTNAQPSNTILRATGTLKQGDVIVSTPWRHNVVGNPYPSAVDLDLIEAYFVRNRFYLWDPNRGSFGAWISVQPPDYNPSSTGGSYSDPFGDYRVIEPGAAFVIAGRGGTSVKFTEESKAISTHSDVFRKAPRKKMIVNVGWKNAGGSMVVADGLTVYFDSLHGLVPHMETEKMKNFGENLATVKNGILLMEDQRFTTEERDTIQLEMWNFAKGKYQFQISSYNFTIGGPRMKLVDSYTDSSYFLSPAQSTTIAFTINTDSASIKRDRFKIILKSPLADLQFHSLQARSHNCKYTLKWSVTNAHHVILYEVEGSVDSVNFFKVGEIPAVNDSATNYSYNTNISVGKPMWFRIKAVGPGNRIKYSATTLFQSERCTSMNLLAYPNPASKAISCLFDHATKGQYTVQLVNQLGHKVASRIFYHDGKQTTIAFDLSHHASGLLRLVVTGSNKQIIETIIIKQ
jgi:hypothetical protein